jgi:hypothetical protein
LYWEEQGGTREGDTQIYLVYIEGDDKTEGSPHPPSYLYEGIPTFPFPHLCALRALSLALIPPEHPGSAAGILFQNGSEEFLAYNMGPSNFGAPSSVTREAATIAIQALLSCGSAIDHVIETARIPLLSLWALLPPDLVVMVSIQKGYASPKANPLTLLSFHPLYFPGSRRHYRRLRLTKRLTYWPSKLSSRRAFLAARALQLLATMSKYIVEILFFIHVASMLLGACCLSDITGDGHSSPGNPSPSAAEVVDSWFLPLTPDPMARTAKAAPGVPGVTMNDVAGDEGSPVTGGTLDTDVAGEAPGSTGAPSGSLPEAGTPPTPAVSTPYIADGALLACMGLTPVKDDDEDDSSGDAGLTSVTPVVVHSDAGGAGDMSDTDDDGSSLASGDSSVTGATKRASVTSGVLTDVVVEKAVSATRGVPRDTDTVDPVSAFAVILAPGEDEELSIASVNTSTAAPIEDPPPRAPLPRHVYSERWSALGPVSSEKFLLTRPPPPEEAPGNLRGQYCGGILPRLGPPGPGRS